MNDRMMLKPVGIMPNHLDVREITYSNLLLLEFNPSEMESKYRVVFNRDMFALPNKKAMEVVMHFLFMRLHPQLAYEEFRDCWPVRDKVLEQQFRKVCFNWVSRIQKEDPEARLPRIVQSLFHSPGGDRFYSFLHHFSLYVLVKVMYRDHGKIGSIPTFPTKTIHNQSFTHVMSKALEAHYMVLKKRFLEFTQCAVVVENHWKDFAVETTKESRALVKKKRELERQIRQLDGSVSSHGVARVKTDYQEEVEALKRTQNLQKQIPNLSRKIARMMFKLSEVKTKWFGTCGLALKSFTLCKHLVDDHVWLWSSFHSCDEYHCLITRCKKCQRQIVDSVLRGDANKYKIDASDIQPMVPDLLLRDCEKEIRMNLLLRWWGIEAHEIGVIKRIDKKNIGNTFVSGKVNLLSLIQLWNLSLNKIKEQLYQGPIPNLDEDSPAVRSALYTHHAHLKNSKTLSEAVQGIIPTMKEHINQMKSHCYKVLEESHNGPQEKHVSFNLGLGLVPPTPPLSFAAADTPAAERITSFQDTLKLSPETVSTPDVIQAWTKSVRGQQSASKEVSESKKEIKKREPSRLPRPKQQLTQQDLVSPIPKAAKDMSRAGLRSHKILADQIADAVTMDQWDSTSLSSSAPSSRASTPKVQALEDPIGALGQDAFQPRDLIPRTPAKTEAGYPLSSHRTPSGDKRGLRQPLTAPQSGRLLETILDHSEEQSTPISAGRELHSAGATTWHGTIQFERENASQDSGKPLTPVSVKTALFKEPPSSLHGQSLHNYTGEQTPGFTRNEFLLGTSPRESESTSLFNLSEVQQTPKLVETSLFGGATTSEGETHHSLYFGLDHTPAPAKTSLCQGSSPGLGALLLPRGTLLDYSEGDLLHSGAKHDVSPMPSRYVVDYETLSVGITPASVKAAPSPRFQELLLQQGSLGSHSTMAAVRGTPSSQRSLQRVVEHDVRGIDQIIQSPLKNPNVIGSPLVIGLPSTPKIGNIEAETHMKPDIWPSSRTVGASFDTETPRQSRTVTSDEQVGSSRSVKTSIRALNKDSSASHTDHSPAHEVDTRALIERLNKIKLTQQSTDSFLFTPTRPFQSSGQDNTPRLENTAGGLSDTSLLANRLNQIKQAQRSQQVTPGSNTGEDLGASRPSEAALLTPLTTSSRETPSEEDARTSVTKFTFYSPHYSFSPPGSPFPSPDEKLQHITPFEIDQEFVSPSQGIALSFSSEVGLAEGDLGLVEGFHWETATPSLPQRHTKLGCFDNESSPPIAKLNDIPHSPFSYDPSTPLSTNSDGQQNIKTTVAEAQLFPGSINGFTQQETLGKDYATPVKHDGSLSPVVGQLIDLE